MVKLAGLCYWVIGLLVLGAGIASTIVGFTGEHSPGLTIEDRFDPAAGNDNPTENAHLSMEEWNQLWGLSAVVEGVVVIILAFLISCNFMNHMSLLEAFRPNEKGNMAATLGYVLAITALLLVLLYVHGALVIVGLINVWNVAVQDKSDADNIMGIISISIALITAVFAFLLFSFIPGEEKEGSGFLMYPKTELRAGAMRAAPSGVRKSLAGGRSL